MIDLKTVLIVHCVDAEGPLHESLRAKFERLEALFGIKHILPTKENFIKLQNAEFKFAGLEKEIATIFNSHLVNYNDTWDKVDAMLERIMAPDFRNKMSDSYGGGWIYNWHCVDHIGYKNNPRRRDIGYHNIFDHYKAVLGASPNCQDTIQWHFHPMSTYRDAHRNATSYVGSPELHQILCRRILERKWFPTVNRAGFHIERPDSNWFLEQWLPFDISNISKETPNDFELPRDFKLGRTGDWRLAPSDWSIYQPSHDNYQLAGSCRRWIARILNVLNRTASIDQKELDKAFKRAQTGTPTLVGITGHDFRNLATEIDYVRELISESAQKHPDVKYKYCEVIEAFRAAIWPDGIEEDPLEFDIELHPATADDVPYLEVITKKGSVFGPQPFLAIQTRSRRFIHDNFDFSRSLDRWYYPLYSNTLPIDDVAKIGVAANDKFGNVCVQVIDLH